VWPSGLEGGGIIGIKLGPYELTLKGLQRLPHSRRMGGGGWINLPNGQVDYVLEVGEGLTSSAVMAPVNWIARNFPEAPVIVADISGGQPERIANHTLEKLLARPNLHYSGVNLSMASMVSWSINGNAYWVKVRDERRAVKELWYVPHWMISPKQLPDSSEFLDYYEYSINGQRLRLDPADVIHFKFGIDPSNMRLGMSPLASLLREIYTDNEAAAFTSSILRNLGIPGLVISPKTDTGAITDAISDELREKLEHRFSAERRGKPVVFTAPTDIYQFGFDPQQLDLAKLRRITEERITAVLGVPAIVAGLGAGLERSTFANYAEAREAAYESNIIPTQRLFASTLEVSLLPDFEASPERFAVSYDNSNVRVLQEDENRRAERWVRLYEGGVAKRAEARRAQGLEVNPGDEVYVKSPTAVLQEKANDYFVGLKTWTPSRLAAEEKEADAALARWEQRILKRIKTLLDAEEAGVVVQLEGTLLTIQNAGLVLDETQWSKLLEDAYIAVSEAFGERTAQRYFGRELSEAFENQAVRFAQEEAARKVTQICGFTRERLRTLVTEAVAAGDSLQTLAAAIRSEYAGWRSSRAATIARTEVGSAANWGAHTAGQQTISDYGLEAEKVWIATRDDRTRNSHQRISGERAAASATFSNGLLYPHDPRGRADEVVNCRCALAWEVSE
jgi:HK97 family phage portal protein